MKLADEHTIGGRIRSARQGQGLKAKELAQMIGITPNYMSMVEQGARTPSDELLGKVAEATHTTLVWLKNGEPQREAGEQTASTATEPVTNDLPDPQLFLLVLKWQRPDLFPDAVQAILDVSSDTLEGLLDGKVGYDPKWRLAFELLAQRMDWKAIRGAFATLNAFLERTKPASIPQDISAVIRRYLDNNNASAYKQVKEQAPVEQYEIGGGVLKTHTLTYADGKEHWLFKSVEATCDPKFCGDLLAQIDGAEIVDIIREQLDYAASQQISLVFRDVGLHNLFEGAAGRVQTEAEESGHYPEGMENLSLLLVEQGKVTDCIPLCRD